MKKKGLYFFITFCSLKTQLDYNKIKQNYNPFRKIFTLGKSDEYFTFQQGKYF